MWHDCHTHTKHHHSGVGFSPEFSSCTVYMQNPGTLNTASSHFASTNESVQASRHVHFHKCMDNNQLHLKQCPPSSTLKVYHISDHDDTYYGPTVPHACQLTQYMHVVRSTWEAVYPKPDGQVVPSCWFIKQNLCGLIPNLTLGVPSLAMC